VATKLIWRGDEAQKYLLEDARQKVWRCCLLLESDIKRSMKKGGRTPTGKAERKMAKVGTYHSAPGEVPRVQTGRLRASITSELHPRLPIGRVGTNVVYSKWLELGTRKMAARPYLRPALQRNINRFRRIFSRPCSKFR